MIHIIHECDFIMLDKNPENAKCRICGKPILADVVLPEPKEEKPVNFIKYVSIENSYRERFIQKIREEGLDGGTWIATNKIHGANFQVCADSTHVKFAKRSGFIEEKENFYGLHTSLKPMKSFLVDRIKRMQNYFGATINVYFELFGGGYSHPDVRPSNVPMIQKGVFYTPNIDIRVLDVVLDFDEYLDFDEMMQIVSHFDLRPIRVMNRGTFDEMLALDSTFDDPTYLDYGLPKIEGNISEGFVIRPNKTVFTRRGERVILKNKNEKFAEKSRAPRKDRQPSVIPENIKAIYEDLVNAVTENRLRNILSHGDTFGQKDFGKLQGMMMQDIIKEEGDALNELDKHEVKQVKNLLNKDIADLIRPNFLNIIDGVY